MFKLPKILPDTNSTVEEFTDFIEWECFVNQQISTIAVLKPIIVAQDELSIDGINDETDKLVEKLEDVMAEMDRRRLACGGNYPFVAKNKGYSITFASEVKNSELYIYLLLSTRLDMLKNKVHNGIDGTKTLEKISAPVAQEYFGPKSLGVVFGTAVVGGFKAKIEKLIDMIGEGVSFSDRDAGLGQPKDGNLDVLVVKNFSDKKASKLIGFGQCKTGTTWDEHHLLELQPEVFCSTYFFTQPIVLPVKMFFCSQYFPLDFYSKAKSAGLVFDRFRIMDFSPTLNLELIKEVRVWVKAATEFSKITTKSSAVVKRPRGRIVKKK